VDIRDKTGETALQAFFRNLDRTHNPNHATEIAIRMLSLSAKSELDRQLPNGSRLFNLAIIFKNDKLIQELYNLGVNTEERDSTQEYRSPLELFCIHGARDTEILRSLIKACKNLSELDFKGLGLLHLASDSGHIKVVRELIEGGLNVNIQSRDRLTALCYAVSAGHTSIVELLLDNGAKNDSCPSSENWKASLLFCAPNVATCILLDDRGIGDWTERTQCSFQSRFVPGFTSYRLGQSTADIWVSRLVHRLTPLHHMAFKGYLDVFKYVVEHVKDIDVDVVAEVGIRPLFFAVLSGKVSLVRYLLEQGARPDHVFMPARWTALHLAAHLGNFEIVTNLLEHGASRYWGTNPPFLFLTIRELLLRQCS
jgi:ankyrin repeat protein